VGEQGQIRVLPVEVANKIAAGEVVERPASVVKELVENALDAGSTEIRVDVTAGGRKRMTVSDNGCGMNRDDALLSIEQHATSKIRDVTDIERIATLGFRGEALPAIASVSRFRLVTCRRDEAAGTELLISGGKIQDVREIGCPAGTLVEVRDLFFNVPARRKFLRAAETELAHIRSGFIVHAIAHPAVGMSLTIDGREAYRLPDRSALENRLRELFGSAYFVNLRPAEDRCRGVRVTGYVGLPAVHRSDRDEQYVFVNGRPTGAPLIHHAIREGYHTLLPAGRHPCVFLFIEMDPEGVDVNVHPAKREVRFREPGDVRDAIIGAIRRALGGRPAATPPPWAAASDAEAAGPGPARQRAEGGRLEIQDLPLRKAFRYPRRPIADLSGMGRGAAGPDAAVRQGGERPADPGSASPGPASASSHDSPWSWCRVVGQVGTLYVVLETDEGLVLMDPHAAHERVLFDRYLREVLEGAVQSQALLLPQSAELQPRDAVRVRKHLDVLRRMGFGVCEFGADAFVVDALPACLAAGAVQPMLIEIAQNLEQAGTRGADGRWQEEAVAQAACKAAVRAKSRLTIDETERLVVELAQTEMPYTCPHGRPTLILTTYAELDKKFGRE
jgi:DNA mismatch repair protein MutL